MSVIQQAPFVSRAASLPLVGGSLALDFANTESGRQTDQHQDHLREAEDVVAWLEHAGSLSPDEADALRAALSSRPDGPVDLLSRTLELRSAIQDVGAAIGEGRPPPEIALAALASLHVTFLSRAILLASPAACRWRWAIEAAPVEAALGSVALEAARLFTEGDFRKIKRCGGSACGWLFYDTTKNNRRRWCEMEVCGNRAKQRRLAARRQSA
jgi:predicted RNA-binding Zn ribbon-like protein